MIALSKYCSLTPIPATSTVEDPCEILHSGVHSDDVIQAGQPVHRRVSETVLATHTCKSIGLVNEDLGTQHVNNAFPRSKYACAR